jgi:hypothetical protein
MLMPTVPLESKETSADLINQFEADPYGMMVQKEIARSSSMASITPEVSFITNLQNIKQGLKADRTDKEILDMLLVDLNFTEDLIKQHLSTGGK